MFFQMTCDLRTSGDLYAGQATEMFCGLPKTSPDFPSAWGWADNNWLFMFGWTYPLRRGRPTSIIHDIITTSLEVNPGPICNLYKRDVETWSLQRCENGVYSEAEDIFCPEGTQFTYS